MLNGIDPIIIFQIYKKVSAPAEALAEVPLSTKVDQFLAQPPIPLYLSEELTGLIIESESKNIDASTQTETQANGGNPEIIQGGVSSMVTVDLIANKNSLGVTLFSAMADLIFDKLTSKEYSITYLSGATTVFNGLLHSFSVSQDRNSERLSIKVELSRGPVRTTGVASPLPKVTPVTGTTPVGL